MIFFVEPNNDAVELQSRTRLFREDLKRPRRNLGEAIKIIYIIAEKSEFWLRRRDVDFISQW